MPQPSDPTYVKAEIDANSRWKLAFELSELDNDDAPIGWFQYINIADWILRRRMLLTRSDFDEGIKHAIGLIYEQILTRIEEERVAASQHHDATYKLGMINALDNVAGRIRVLQMKGL